MLIGRWLGNQVLAGQRFACAHPGPAGLASYQLKPLQTDRASARGRCNLVSPLSRRPEHLLGHHVLIQAGDLCLPRAVRVLSQDEGTGIGAQSLSVR